MQITIDTPPLDSITDHRAALVTLDGQLWRAKLEHVAHEGWELLGPA